MVIVSHARRAATPRRGRAAAVAALALAAVLAPSGAGAVPAPPAGEDPALAPATVETAMSAGAVDGAMPVGDLPGWKQVTAEDFTGSVPLGSWAGSSYARSLYAYDAMADTTGRGWYDPATVLSVKDGVLDLSVHTADGRPRVAAVVPKIPATGWGQTYGRYSMRFRSDTLENYKMVAMLWPDSDNWGEGEIDLMEVGELDWGNTVYANLYPRGSAATGTPGTPTGFRSTVRADGTGWHVATAEWEPGSVTYWLDGVKLGTTTTPAVPSTRMHLVVQVETAVGLPAPSATVAGHVQVDWITQYTRVPTAPQPGSTVPDVAAAPVHRFWSPRFGNAHFFTMDAAEAQRLATSDPNWVDEGTAFAAYPASAGACASGTTPVFRFWSAAFTSHFFTASAEEATAIASGDRNWAYEGVAYCAATSAVPGAVPLYRFWSPRYGKHFYTASAAEAHQLDVVDPDWDAEGVAYYVQPAG